MSEVRVQTLIDQQAIRDVLARYCRGLDRMDKEMAYGVFHPDAPVDYVGIYEGTGHGFIDWVWEAHAAMERHSHQITQSLIEVDGDRASSEAYVTVVLWTRPDEQGRQDELVGRGRYLDRWERRDGRWAIAHRVHLLDLSSRLSLDRADVSEGATRDTTDRSYDFLAQDLAGQT